MSLIPRSSSINSIFTLFLATWIASCDHDPNALHTIYCDAEKVLEYNGTPYFISNGPSMKRGDLQNNEEAFSGNFSAKLSQSTGMHFKADFFEPGDHYEISVWAKGDLRSVYLYIASDSSIVKGNQIVNDKEGWQKMRIKGQLDDRPNQVFFAFFSNDSKEPVYFDDFTIKKVISSK